MGMSDDLISRTQAIEALCREECGFDRKGCKVGTCYDVEIIEDVPSVQPTHTTPSNTLGALDCVDRQFEEIVVEYPNITDEEHKGKPYYSIKYIENGEDKIIGFGTYKIEVLSRYIRDYFIQSVQPELSNNSKELDKEIGECNDCIKHGGDWECDRVHCHKGDVPNTNVGKWIPCSERLPDVGRRVLLSGHGMVMIGRLHSFGKYSLEPTGISYIYPKDDIEAWLPLPEPYKGDEE